MLHELSEPFIARFLLLILVFEMVSLDIGSYACSPSVASAIISSQLGFFPLWNSDYSVASFLIHQLHRFCIPSFDHIHRRFLQWIFFWHLLGSIAEGGLIGRLGVNRALIFGLTHLYLRKLVLRPIQQFLQQFLTIMAIILLVVAEPFYKSIQTILLR